MNKTFVIAEAGANHDRKFDQALKLVDLAVDSGCDAVKFQTYSSDTLYGKNTPDFAGYKDINNLIKEIELPRGWQPQLKSYCDDKGIEFMSTPFDEQAVDELVSLGVKRLKIAGFEATDPRFVEVVASTGLPIIMSAGIGFDFKYWGKFYDIFKKYNNHVTLLHCNNAYPTPMEDVCLDSMNSLANLINVSEIGFSDHTMSTLTPSLAVVKGATVIEKHFTLDRQMEGPDHPFALEPNELKEMIQFIREAEKSRGFKVGYTTSEQSFNKARRSVVSKIDLKKGDILTKDNITTKRPFLDNSIPAIDYNDILGQILKDDIKADTPLTKNLISYYEPRTI
jgi:sialic acid synthase SpsE